jgi:hypothetical protein
MAHLTPFIPLSSRRNSTPQVIVGWRGEFKGEGGEAPLSNSLPLSNRRIYALIDSYVFERGIKGVSKKGVRLKKGCITFSSLYSAYCV